MGNSKSTLTMRVERLELIADFDRDGYVSKEELTRYFSDRNKELNEAREEIEEMKRSYDELWRKYNTLLEKSKECSREGKTECESSISRVNIDKFVDTIIDDPETNIYGFPDAIERAIYANTIKIALSALTKVLDTAKLDVLGHSLRANITPNLEVEK